MPRIRELQADNSIWTVSSSSQQSQLQKTLPVETSSEGKWKNVDMAMMSQSLDNALHRKARLSKSGSFPAPTSSRIRCEGRTKLDDKQGEIWHLSQGMESVHGSKDSLAQSMPLLREDGEGSSQRTIGSSKGKTESADRYSRLYETSSRQGIRRYAHRSLKLASENDETKPRVFRRGSTLSELEYRSLKLASYNDGPKPRVFRRGLSLSELEYNSFLPNMDVFGEAIASDLSNIAGSAEQPELSVNTKDGSSDNLDENGEDIIENVAGGKFCTPEQRDETPTDMGCNGRERPGSVLEAPFEEDEMCIIDFLTSEDSDSGLNSKRTSNLEKGENVKLPENDRFSPIELADEEYTPEFCYVKHVLELSGFIGKDHHCTWYSLEQPLSPDLFEEIERQYWDLDLLRSTNESDESRLVRKLIFDLINEALVHIHEKPYLYHPKALSFKCHVYPIPKGQHLLDEVWALVSRSLNWRPNLDALLVAYDLNPNDGWMNLQIESECAALEVEDLILDALLDDVLFAC